MGDFREMRRKRQQLSNEESVAILEKATAGTLALLGDGDYPYAVPISYVYHEGKLFFHSALAGHKVDAIRKCEKASFCVIEQDDVQPKKYTTFFRSVIAFGRIHIIEDEQEKLETARMLGNRYNPNDDESLQKLQLVRGRCSRRWIRNSLICVKGGGFLVTDPAPDPAPTRGGELKKGWGVLGAFRIIFASQTG